MARPFRFAVPQTKIDNLKQLLSLTEFPDELDDASWDMGVPLSEMKNLVASWLAFDFNDFQEKMIKAGEQYKVRVEVDGFGTVEVHVLHQRATKGAIPLLFVHGWPGSFLEVSKILEGLTNPPDGSTAFHVVAPSLPNFGFSQGVNKRGFALAQYAETLQKMMLGLGYEQYVTQAGDWGYWITRAMGKLYPQSVKASLMNMPFASPPTWKSPLARIQAMMPYDEGDRTGVQRRGRFKREGRGYNEVQSTRPQTLAYALASSPVALLAWMYEKLHDWTDAYPWSNDEIITWVSIYWFSEAGPGAAARIYYETAHTERGTTGCTYEELQEWIGGVKLGLVFNPRELEPVPKSWGATLGEVIYQVENPGGGHFYAHEEPELLLRDLREMFRKGGGAFGVVKGADGC